MSQAPSRWDVARRLLVPERRDVFALLGYQPSPKQSSFHEATEYDVLYGGAAGGGKSKALVMHALRAADWYPGMRLAIFRRSYDELAESIIPELAAVAFGEALGVRWNASTTELRFPNGSVIRLRYLENLTDASRRQGGQYQLIEIDERTQIVPGAVEQVKERLRTRVGSGVPLLGLRSTSNPGGASHGQVKERYIDGTDYGEHVYTDEHGETVRFIPATVDDNPHIDPGYKKRLEGIPDPARRAAMRFGSWDMFSGQVFTEWRRERHVVAPWLLPASWERYMAVDWGYTAPWAVLWIAVDEDERLWVYRELYSPGVGEREQARRILAAEADGRVATPDGEAAEPEPDLRLGDPSMAAKRGDAESIMAAYSAEGVDLEPANNDRLAGWQRIHQYLSEGPACPHHRAQGWETCPRLHVFSGCVNLIRTLPALPYDAHRTEDVDTHADDHAGDALRYALMSIGTGAEFFFPEDDRVTVSELDETTPLLTQVGPYAVDPEVWRTPYRR